MPPVRFKPQKVQAQKNQEPSANGKAKRNMGRPAKWDDESTKRKLARLFICTPLKIEEINAVLSAYLGSSKPCNKTVYNILKKLFSCPLENAASTRSYLEYHPKDTPNARNHMAELVSFLRHMKSQRLFLSVGLRGLSNTRDLFGVGMTSIQQTTNTAPNQDLSLMLTMQSPHPAEMGTLNAGYVTVNEEEGAYWPEEADVEYLLNILADSEHKNGASDGPSDNEILEKDLLLRPFPDEKIDSSLSLSQQFNTDAYMDGGSLLELDLAYPDPWTDIWLQNHAEILPLTRRTPTPDAQMRLIETDFTQRIARDQRLEMVVQALPNRTPSLKAEVYSLLRYSERTVSVVGDTTQEVKAPELSPKSTDKATGPKDSWSFDIRYDVTSSAFWYDRMTSGEILSEHISDYDRTLRDSHGNSLFHLAVIWGASISTLENLIEAGFDPTMKNSWGENALHVFINSKNCILSQASPTYINDFLSLLRALPNFNINASNMFCYTALHLAIEYDEVSLQKILFSFQDLDVNAKNTYGRTALHEAALYSNYSTLEMLLKDPRVNINEMTYTKETALDLAGQRLKRDLNTSILPDLLGLDARAYAENLTIISLLERHGAKASSALLA